MAVKHIDETYLCKVCGNQVIVVKVGGGTLVCCGKAMVQNEAMVQNKKKIGGDSRENTVYLP